MKVLIHFHKIFNLYFIRDYICQILEMGNKFLIFAHHKEVLNEISKLLEEKQT